MPEIDPDGTPLEGGELLADEVWSPPVTESDRVFEGRVWNVLRESFDYNGSSLVRDYVEHTGAVAVLVLDDEERVLLVKQYRHPVRSREWELPAGLLDLDGEDALTAAQRELAEEADVEADSWHLLAEFFTSPGGSDEAIRVYLARDVRATRESHARTDEEADMEIRWVPLDEVVEAVLDRRVQNPSLVVGALAADARRRRSWAGLADADEPWSRDPRAFRNAAG